MTLVYQSTRDENNKVTASRSSRFGKQMVACSHPLSTPEVAFGL